MWKWIVAVVCLVITFVMRCALKAGSDFDDEMEEGMKEGENHECKGLSETAKEAG